MLCVTHLAAMQAAAAAGRAAPMPPGGLKPWHAEAMLAAAAVYVGTARACPAIVTSTFLQPLHALLAPLAQASAGCAGQLSGTCEQLPTTSWSAYPCPCPPHTAC